MLPVLYPSGGDAPVPKSLLLADDSVTIQKAVEMTFRAEDVILTIVSDGNEALSQAREAKPDLILADVGMPGLGGYELCEKVRADAGIRHIPVLLLGGGTPIDPAKAIAVGANGHMPKPFDSGKLIDQVKQILANPRAAVAPAAAKPAAAPAASRPPPPRPAAPAPGMKPPLSAPPGAARPPPPKPGISAPPAAARPAAPGAARPPVS